MVINSCPGLNSQQMIIITCGLIITLISHNINGY